MTYVVDGENEIGVALSESWAAVWTVDTPYINVLRRDFWDLHSDEITEANEQGRDFGDENGQTGCVHAISTAADVNENGLPQDFDDVSAYVASKLTAWIQEDGDAYEEAVTNGYGR